MDIFTQLVLLIGRISPEGVKMLGTGFIVSSAGRIATARHVCEDNDSNLVILTPHITKISEYQDLSDTSCQPVAARIIEVDPIHDVAILGSDALSFSGALPLIGSLDDVSVGDSVGIFGYPHCVAGRRALTFHSTEIGAKVITSTAGISSKQIVINTQARPGQSGSLVFSTEKQSIVAVLIGAWAPPGPRAVLAGIDPAELHQTTHCVSAEYIKEML